MRRSRTQILVECGLMVALAMVLSYIPLFEMPMGGTITLCSMVPVVFISFRHGWRWGILTGFANGLVQMLMGMKNVMLCTTIWTMIVCILLDYMIAFAVIGASSLFAGRWKNQTGGVVLGTVTACVFRFICSFLSGILIWGGYAPEGTPVWIYSLTYNGSYMVPEMIITVVAAALIIKRLKKVY